MPETKFQENILADIKNWLNINQHDQWNFDDQIANDYSIATLTSQLNDSIKAVLKTAV
jgi:hypothetical protein